MENAFERTWTMKWDFGLGLGGRGVVTYLWLAENDHMEKNIKSTTYIIGGGVDKYKDPFRQSLLTRGKLQDHDVGGKKKATETSSATRV